MELETLSFRDRFDILLEKRPGGGMLYGKSQLNKGNIMKRILFLVLVTFCFSNVQGEETEEAPKPVKRSITVKLQKADPVEGAKFLPPLGDGKKWKLAWCDEFNGKTIDGDKWNILGDHVRKDGYWLKEDVRVDGKGSLEIRVKKKGDKYTTGAISTKGKFEKRFGYFVARCRFTGARGHGPAFWLQSPGVSKVGNDGRDGTEIDIMEKFKNYDRVQHAMHWDGYGKYLSSSACQIDLPGISEGWHTFALYWSPDEYIFYIDGRQSWRTKDGGVSQVPAYIILSDEIRAWNGDISKQKLPRYFRIDYVRVYEIGKDDWNDKNG